MSDVPIKRFTLRARVRGVVETFTVIVDESDAYLLRTYAWGVSCDDRGNKYVTRHLRMQGGSEIVSLHRVIFSAAHGDIVIHRNGETLDCRRANLRKLRGAEAHAYMMAVRYDNRPLLQKFREAP